MDFHFSYTLFKIKKNNYLFSFCSNDLFWPDLPKSLAKISQEARELEGLVKITYGIVAIAPFLKEREIQIR